MTDKIKEFVDSLFEGAPLTREVLDLKEQTIANTTARYNALLSEGKSEQAAFSAAVAGIGDISQKIDELNRNVNTNGSAYSSQNSYNEYQTIRDRNIIRRSASTALWMLIVIAYFLVSFLTHAWHITWLIFLIGVAIEQIVKICFELRRK